MKVQKRAQPSAALFSEGFVGSREVVGAEKLARPYAALCNWEQAKSLNTWPTRKKGLLQTLWTLRSHRWGLYLNRKCTLSRVQLFATPWTVAHQAPLSMGFPRQENWSGCHLLLQGSFPMSLASPALAGGFFTTAPPNKSALKRLKSTLNSDKFLTGLRAYSLAQMLTKSKTKYPLDKHIIISKYFHNLYGTPSKNFHGIPWDKITEWTQKRKGKKTWIAETDTKYSQGIQSKILSNYY